MDRNDYYGGESASLTLNQLWEKFMPGQEVPKDLGRPNDYNVDMVPKFIMANGKLVQVLIHTDVTKVTLTLTLTPNPYSAFPNPNPNPFFRVRRVYLESRTP